MRTGLQSFVLPVAACASLGAAAVLVAGGCIVVPPPEWGIRPARPPRILHDSVSPPEGIPFSVWPDVFVVPVEMDNPDPTVRPEYSVSVDPGTTSVALSNLPLAPAPTDGGLVLIHFVIDPQQRNIDRGECHIITARVWDRTVDGSDTVPWVYGGSAAPYGCPVRDAGAAQNGQFSEAGATDP